MRIDSHHHIWDLDLTPQDWIDPVSMAVINQNFLLSDLRKEIVASGIEKTVIVQTVTNYEETPVLLDLASKDELVAGVVGWLKIDALDAIAHLEQFLDLPGANYLKGIRDIVQDHPDSNYLARPQAIKNVQELGRRGIVFDLLTKTPELSGAIEMVKSCPNTQFVMDHISKPYISKGLMEPWKKLIYELAAYENVVCKVSGMITEADHRKWKSEDFKPYFEIILDAFGIERLMFGSDWPVCNLAGNYSQVVGLVEKLSNDLSTSEKSLLWGEVANKTYKLAL